MPILEDYLKRINHHLPNLIIHSASLNTDGLVNVIVFVNDNDDSSETAIGSHYMPESKKCSSLSCRRIINIGCESTSSRSWMEA